jgi:hypothetical protein
MTGNTIEMKVTNPVTDANVNKRLADIIAALSPCNGIKDALIGNYPSFDAAQIEPRKLEHATEPYFAAVLTNNYVSQAHAFLDSSCKSLNDAIRQKTESLQQEFFAQHTAFLEEFNARDYHAVNANLKINTLKHNLACALQTSASQRHFHYLFNNTITDDITRVYNDIFKDIAAINADGELILANIHDAFAKMSMQEIQTKLTEMLQACDKHNARPEYLSGYLSALFSWKKMLCSRKNNCNYTCNS